MIEGLFSCAYLYKKLIPEVEKGNDNVEELGRERERSVKERENGEGVD